MHRLASWLRRETGRGVKISLGAGRLILLALLALGVTNGAAWAGAGTTSLTISYSDNPIRAGDPVTITATVTTDAGDLLSSVGTGLVFFIDGDQVGDPMPLTGTSTSASASITTTFSTVGPHVVWPVFNGDNINADTEEPITVLSARATVTLTSEPSEPELGAPVTFNARVVAPAGDVTNGFGVSFLVDGEWFGDINDPADVIGTALDGTASITTSFSTLGPHTVEAYFSGTATVDATDANDSLTVTVVTPADSLELAAIQNVASQLAALNSGRAFTSSVQEAVYGGFNMGTGLSITPGGVRLNYAPTAAGPNVPWPENGAADPAFQIWADLSVAGVGEWGIDAAADSLSGLQFNGLGGLTYKLSPDFLVGVVGGFEAFDYASETLDAELSGDGWTVGGYGATQLGDVFEAYGAVGYSGLSYDGTAGAASGSFDAQRWIVSGGLTGTIEAYGFSLEPSLSVFALSEHQNGYTDSLAFNHAAREMFTSQASAGARLAFPIVAEGLDILPYAGLYADYAIDGDSDGLADLGLNAPLDVSGGLSARVTGGVETTIDGGATLNVGGEFGGIGATYQTWSVSGGVGMAF